MEQGKKIHFFCSKKRIDIAVQTENNAFFFLRNREKESNIYDNFHNSCQDSILTQSCTHAFTHIETYFISKIRSKVAFNVSILKDDRFDTLSLPNDSEDQPSSQSLNTYQNFLCSPALYVEFKENDFSISNLEANTSCKYTYSMNSYHLFNALQTGLINDHFLTSIDSNITKNIKYENGYCICDITDFRFKPQMHKRIKLRIDQNASNQFLNFVLSSKSNLLTFISNKERCRKANESKKDMDDDHFKNKNIINNLTDDDLNEIKVKTEKKLILKFHPAICTDPSPDVARVQSIIDFRSKMWNKTYKDQFYMDLFSSRLPDIHSKSNYSSDEHLSIGRIPPVEVKDTKIQTQFNLPSSIRSYFPNFDAPLNYPQ